MCAISQIAHYGLLSPRFGVGEVALMLLRFKGGSEWCHAQFAV